MATAYEKAQNYNSKKRKTATIVVSIVLTIILFFIANLHYRNYIDTETTNIAPTVEKDGKIEGPSMRHKHNSWMDRQYRWLIEDLLGVKIN